MKKIGIIGAGSWGTALALTVSNKGHQVKICDVDKEHIALMREHNENVKYLPGIKFNENLHIVDTTEEALEDADIALFSAPAQHFRSAFEGAIPYLNDNMVVVNVAKGIEQHTLMRMSEIAYLLKPDVKYVVLSGPSHDSELCKLFLCVRLRSVQTGQVRCGKLFLLLRQSLLRYSQQIHI